MLRMMDDHTLRNVIRRSRLGPMAAQERAKQGAAVATPAPTPSAIAPRAPIATTDLLDSHCRSIRI
jgi:hypothetical protein